jgi:alpha-D-ribose 1-methylphosphonate 5-phosphate C-P lyase
LTTPKKKARYGALRPHAARIIKVAEYPVHVNGAYLDDPDRIPMFDPRPKDRRDA